MTTHYTPYSIPVTITAGMDGDEYAGIEAAKILKKRYKTFKNITVLPLLNPEGYKNGTSFSPLDQKYPKYVFPGSPNGTDTEKRMYELYQSHIQHSRLWIDLHGGSTHEIMSPFIWVYQSKHNDIRAFHERMIETTSAPCVIFDKKPFMTYSTFLDKHNIIHILCECGDRGTRRKKDIHTLITWVDEILFPNHKSYTKPTIFTSVTYEFKKTKIPDNTTLLWENIHPNYKQGEVFCAYAK